MDTIAQKEEMKSQWREGSAAFGGAINKVPMNAMIVTGNIDEENRTPVVMLDKKSSDDGAESCP